MSNIKILLAEDDVNLGILLKNYLNAKKYSTVLCENGNQALNEFTPGIFSLCILDIMMPEMDGFQTIKHIKLNKKWTDIPVFAVTAKAMKDDKDIILKHGFSDYIPKPVNPTIVSFKIHKLISQLKAE